MKNWGKISGDGVQIRIINMIMKETHRGIRGSSYFFEKKTMGKGGVQLAP